MARQYSPAGGFGVGAHAHSTSPATSRASPARVCTRSAPVSSTPAVTPSQTCSCWRQRMRAPVALGDHARHASSSAGPPLGARPARGGAAPARRAARPARRRDRRRGRRAPRATRRARRSPAGRRDGRRLTPRPTTTAESRGPSIAPSARMPASLRGGAPGAVDDDVVRPLQRGADAGRVGDRLDHGDAGHHRQQAHRRIDGRTDACRRAAGTRPRHRDRRPVATPRRGRAGRGRRSARRRRSRRLRARRPRPTPARRRWSTPSTATTRPWRAERAQLAARGVEQRLEMRRTAWPCAARARRAQAVTTTARARSRS